MKTSVVIFAGGSGARMGAGTPKQFLEVGGKPVIIHTIECFEYHPAIDEIYVVCKEEYIQRLESMLSRYYIGKVVDIVPGGKTALDSIYIGLQTVAAHNEDGIVLIHDGVRPCVSTSLIDAVIDGVKKNGNAITCTSMYETPIYSSNGDVVENSPNRSHCYTAQAPQGFMLRDILAAYQAVSTEKDGFDKYPDSCTLMSSRGVDVHIIKGDRGNIKVTTPEDLYIFRGMLRYREAQEALGLTQQETIKGLKK